MAAPRDTTRLPRPHRGHRLTSGPTPRHDGRGSPQPSHRGGVNDLIEVQHAPHTGPRVGSWSGRSQAAHAGASKTESSASASLRDGFLSDFDSFSISPEPLERIEGACLWREHMDDEG